MKEEYCPIHEVTKLIGGKWKMPLMYVIQSGPKRFGELRNFISNNGTDANQTIKRT